MSAAALGRALDAMTGGVLVAALGSASHRDVWWCLSFVAIALVMQCVHPETIGDEL